MDDRIFKRSLIRSIALMADIYPEHHIYEEGVNDQRIRAMMQAYLAIKP
ncbi:MAG: hypothetical protein U9O96_04340 [Candidatus Thermoplasmatota archaeon]|nr:hypothetical protein [Candidatus Thermoplasmatota archaeon]